MTAPWWGTVLTAEKWDNNGVFRRQVGPVAERVTPISTTTIVIDKTGRVASRMDGFDPSTFLDQMTDRIQALLGSSAAPAK